MIAHCELMGDRVAILDAPPGLNAQQVKEWRVDKAGYDSKYATLYWPWVKVFDPATGQATLRAAVAATWPASGRRNDDTRGVHKAPANEVVRGAITLELNITKDEHDLLNPIGINCIRAFPGPRHPRLGRPHALVSDPAWRYLNVRRLFNYLEESILNGTQWVVFEPNDDGPVGRGSGAPSAPSWSTSGARARCSAPTPGRGVLRQVRRARPTRAEGDRRRPGRRARSASRR